jgi:4-amino-4-deoxy-L-arabinose transferase-like glycosyltransferase
VNSRLKTALTIAAIVVLAALVSARWLGGVPAYLADDEVFIALDAYSIASTGHDLTGRFLPLYFQWHPQFFTSPAFGSGTWFQPMEIYLTALVLKVLPASDAAMRLPSIALGVTDIVLMYFIAARIFKRERWAAVAAATLALTPAHFIHSRMAMDYLYPVPFILAWFLCLLVFMERRRLWVLFAATSFLGIGFYSYIAAVVMMPIYLALTLIILLKNDSKPWPLAGVALTGFLWPLLFAMPWVLHNAVAVADTARRYELYDTAGQKHLLGLKALHFLVIAGRASLYWQFFDPGYLFFTGGNYTVSSTHKVGVFLLPLIVCVPVGVFQIVSQRRTWPYVVMLAGFASAPLAACLVDEPGAIDRELEVLPFGVLLATAGIEYLVSVRCRVIRAAGWGLLALIPIHFAYFYADYFNDYRTRSAIWFGGRIRDAFDQVVDRQMEGQQPAIYLSADISYVDWHWRIYTLEHHRENLLTRTVYFRADSLAVESVPAGSVVLVGAGDRAAESLVRAGELRRVALVSDIGGNTCCAILER